MKKKRLVIVNKFRFAVFITIMSLFLILLINSLFNYSKAYSSTYSKYHYIKVIKGDTLWGIATKYNSSKMDIRKLVLQIKTINNIDDAFIKPGDVLKVPDYNSKGE